MKTINMTARQNIWLNKKWNELKKIYGNKCLFCNDTSNLEFAHVHPTKLNGQSRGKNYRYYDIKRLPLCYALLCKPCHLKFDKK